MRSLGLRVKMKKVISPLGSAMAATRSSNTISSTSLTQFQRTFILNLTSQDRPNMQMKTNIRKIGKQSHGIASLKMNQ